MSRPWRIVLIAAGSLAGLILILFIAAIVLIQTPWFHNLVRTQIVSRVEEHTGGAASAGSVGLSWTRWRVDIHDFVLRGLEPATAPPLLTAKRIQIDLTLRSIFSGFADIAALVVDTPRANVIVFPDGRTNIPAPKTTPAGKKSALETMVDLRIRKFDLRNGAVTFADRKSHFSADGRNLRAQLAWQPATAGYFGQVEMNPLNWRLDDRQPLRTAVEIPFTLQKDKISISVARLDTAESHIVASGSIEHLAAPVYRVHANGRLALDDLQRAVHLAKPLDIGAGPRFVTIDIAGSASANRVHIENLHLNLGQSALEGSGTLKGGAGMEFQAVLALRQIGHLFRAPQQPEGTFDIVGTLSLDANNNYLVRANLYGHNLSVRADSTRLAGISIDSALTARPHRIDFTGLRVAVLGGQLTGSASLTNMAQIHFAGNLRNFNIASLARLFGESAPYTGLVSGQIQINGDIKARRTWEGAANLAIAPTRGPGVPLSGRLNLTYNGRGETITLGRSFLDLPHTRIDLSGSLGRQIVVRLVTRDFADFRPVAAIPVTFHQGEAVLNATVAGTLSSPRIAGSIVMTNFAIEGRSFTGFTADLNAARTGVAVDHAVLSRDAFQAQFAAYLGLRNWKPEPSQPLRADITVRNGDLEDVLALAGETRVPAAGALNADAHIDGTLGGPRGSASLLVTNGNIGGDPFQTLAAHVAFTPGAIELPSLELTAGPARITASAVYQYTPNDIRRGVVRAHAAGAQVRLANIPQLVKVRPGLGGTVSWNGDVDAGVTPSGFEIHNLNANLSARGLRLEGRSLGDLNATARTAGNAIHYDVSSDFAGSTIRAAGQTLLTGDHQTTATASIANLPIQPVLELAGERSIPVSGILSASGNFSGTLGNPQVNTSFVVSKGSAYQQPFDRLQATVTYTSKLLSIPNFQMTNGPAELALSGYFAHRAGDWQDGQVRFSVHGNSLQLAGFPAVEQYKPSLAGTVQFTAAGAATLRRNRPPLFSTLNADLLASNLSVNKIALGYIKASAETRGSEVTFTLNSNLALSDIHGTGHMTLAGDYPLTSEIHFSKLTWYALTAWTGAAPVSGITASADGQVTIAGPMARPENLAGELRLTTVEAHAVRQPNGDGPRVNFKLHNEGPVVLALNRSQITVESAHLTGTDTDLTLTGNVGLTGKGTLNLRAAGNVKLGVLETFNPSIFSSGSVVLTAAIMGTLAEPAIDGGLEIKNASFNMLSLPNGITDANGTITFTGAGAVIQNLTGEIGGGKISVTGFVAYGPPEMQFRLEATANRVHLAYPENVTTEVNARLILAGTTSRSILSGTVTILNVALNGNADIASLLAQSTPPRAPTSSTGLIGGITFAVRIQTASGAQFRTNLTENLEATADLTLRGNVDHPGMLGRVSITSGTLNFFGARYTIEQGTITFFNPNQINPNINLQFQTSTQGVTVTLTVSGPMDRLKLSYRSSPPLRFDEIVALLAVHKAPTSNPVLAAYQPPTPQLNPEQQGLSTLLGQALANPGSSTLQRLFGVTRLSVNPLFTGITATPQTTVTVVQQVTPDITLTYMQDTASPNPLTVQIEWAVNPRWSVIAQRDIYGELNLNFLYKRRFR
jgi:translocation and assembly module TamB